MSPLRAGNSGHGNASPSSPVASRNCRDGQDGDGVPPEDAGLVEDSQQQSPPVNGASHSTIDLEPGAFINSRTDYWIANKDRAEVQPDRDVILSTAWNNSGESVVREHHTAKFDAVWADAEQVFRNVLEDVAANVRSGEAHLRELTKRLNRTDRYVETEYKTKPWTGWDVAQLVAVVWFSVMLLGVDVNSAAVTLMASGIEAFREHYWRSALFNLSVIMGGAFLIKSVVSWLETDFARRRYVRIVFVLAGLSVVAAVPVFAQTYSRLTADPISLMTGNGPSSTGATSWLVFALQLLTGNLIAGAMWLTAAEIVEAHRPSVRVENPIWRRVKDDVDKQAAGLRQEREKVGLFQGKLEIIKAKRHQLVTRAVELYRLAAGDAERSRKTSALLTDFLPEKEGRSAKTQRLPKQ